MTRRARMTESEMRRLARAAKAEGGAITVENEIGKITFHPGADLPTTADPANLDKTFMDRLRNRPWARPK